MESLRDFLAESINATHRLNDALGFDQVLAALQPLPDILPNLPRAAESLETLINLSTAEINEVCREVKHLKQTVIDAMDKQIEREYGVFKATALMKNGKCKSKATKTYGKKTSTARPKPAAKATTALKTLNMKKPRMPTSVKIAKEKGKAARVAAFGENRCAASGAAEVDEIAVMTEARNRHDEIADTKTKKKKKIRTIQNTSSATPPTTTTPFTSNALKTTIVTGPHKKKRKPVPSLPLPDDENSIKLIVSAITKVQHGL
ncbi:hypothetical protein AM587_10004523 [Phytophthora nicotianae]|uniref:Uncharacterized protein n=2 Tax=Phytophthora nicotianae TaxID=4792 RepID=A0A0W8E048_PHYNI|nr:hypothetical protein AM587_10004523 [Phytophthora nicotianae]